MTQNGRVNQTAELLASVRTLKEIIAGGMNGEPGQTRIETDPVGMAADIADFAEFAHKNIAEHAGPMDWRRKFNAKPMVATELADLIDAPIPYIIKPAVVRGSLTQVQGIQKGGKSAFDLYLALCASTGTWPFPQHLVADGPLKCLYIAWEDPAIMMAKRLSLYAVGLGFDRKFLPENLTFLFGPDIFVEHDDHMLAFKAAIDELKPDIVFIDTLSHVHLCDENAASEMKIPMKHLDRIARECQIGIVYLHHTSKGSSEKIAQDKSRGSGAIAAAWHVLIDWGVREKNSHVNPVEIQSKYEHEWKQLAIAYEPQKDDVGNVVGVKWTIDTPEDEKQSGVGSTERKRNRIIDTIRKLHETSEWVTAQQIANTCNLGLDQKTVQRNHLRKMCEDGILQCKVPDHPRDPFYYKLAYSNGGGNLTDYQ